MPRDDLWAVGEGFVHDLTEFVFGFLKLPVAFDHGYHLSSPARLYKSIKGRLRLYSILGYDDCVAKPTVIDLFSGAGGISHGFEQAGFSVLAGIDQDADAIKTFGANHMSARAFQADLDLTPPEKLAEQIGIKPGILDCIVGGPPCQGFSKNRAFRHQDGVFVDDPRNHLYWHFFEYIGYLRPKVVLMENVPEILIKENGAFHDAVFERFTSLGYRVEARTLMANEYGVPQRRKRAFFLAGLDNLEVNFPEPTSRSGKRVGHRTPTSRGSISEDRGLFDDSSLFETLPEGPSVWDAISDVHGEYASDLHGLSRYASTVQTVYQRERRDQRTTVANHFPWPLTENQLRRIRLLKEGQGQAHLPKELQTSQGYGSAYRRMQSDAQALTITTWMFHPGSGMFTHPFDDRVITIREAARLQSFQDSFVFHGGYHSQCRQVGNAVAPLVAKAIAQSVLEALGLRAPSTELELVPGD